MRLLPFFLVLICVQLQAQRKAIPMLYRFSDFAYAERQLAPTTLQTRALFDGFARPNSRINRETSKDLFCTFDKSNQTTIFLRQSKDYEERIVTEGDNTYTTFVSVDTLIPTTFFKEKETIYCIQNNDTTAIFSLTDTLKVRPFLDVIEHQEQLESAYIMSFRGGGVMDIDGEKREYWLFINEFDSDNFPCYTKYPMGPSPDMAMYNEIYIDCQTLLPLKKMVYVMACKSKIPATLSACYELKKFPKN